MYDENNTYDVDVVVTITLQAENQNDSCSIARQIVNNHLLEYKNNIFYPDWIGVRKLKY